MKISVLIPLYNQEKYIEECIKSVINQTFNNMEIIIIDDGSTDSSYKIASKFLCDKRIKIIRQNNVGLGETRNRLIRESTGEFVFHIDADDYIAQDCLENMINNQAVHNSDIVFSNFIVINNLKQELKKIKRSFFKKKDRYSSFYLAGFGYKSVCNTLIRKQLYTEHNIKVPKVNYGEDWSVIYKLVYFSHKISHINKYTYFYRKNLESMTYNIGNDSIITN